MPHSSSDIKYAVYPVQWEGIMDNGLSFFEENAGMSRARSLPRPLKELRIHSFGWKVPFGIEIPVGALPYIVQVASLTLESGPEVERKGEPPRTYVFGWEKEIDGKTHYNLWEFFCDRAPKHHVVVT